MNASAQAATTGRMDAVAVVVHRSNPLTALDISAVRGVFTGDLTQWQTLVPDRSGTIRALARAEGSGTAALFAERVLDGAAMPAAITRLTSNEAIVAEVAAQPDAIGYTGLAAIRGAGDRVRVVALRTGPDAVAVAPTLDAVRSAAYPLSRRLSLISVGAPQGIAAAFIGHCAGPPGQELLQRAGYAAVTTP